MMRREEEQEVDPWIMDIWDMFRRRGIDSSMSLQGMPGVFIHGRVTEECYFKLAVAERA